MLVFFFFFTVGCEAIVSGPLNDDGILYQLSTFDINETHPAVVRCLVSCLDRQRIYYPAMALIITSQELFVSVRGPYISSSRDGLYEIHYRNVSSCEAQNNYTMEFEYLIYSNSSIIDRALAICGAIIYFTPFINYSLCWGQLFGIIRYNNSKPITTTPSDLQCHCLSVSATTTELIAGPNIQVELLSLILIPTIVVLILILSLTAAFLHITRLRKKIVPVCVIEEQALVMKVELASEEVQQQKEKETPIDEAGNPPSAYSDIIDHKLPDKISSRDKE